MSAWRYCPECGSGEIRHAEGSHKQCVCGQEWFSDVDYTDVVRGHLAKCIAASGELRRFREWVADLQSGMYVNCVYCGHRYGPGETTPVSMADALKAHVATCPEHPMAKLRSALEKLVGQLEKMADVKGIEPATWLCLIELSRQGRAALGGDHAL